MSRDVGAGAVAVDVDRIRDRTGVSAGLGAEAYLPLWYHAEGYVRAAGAPGAAASPEIHMGGQVLQYLGDRWSVGAGGWYREYDVGDLIQAHVAAGFAEGPWRLRLRVGLVRSDETLPLGHAAVRRDVGSDGGYVEGVLAARDELLGFLPGADEDGVLTTPTAVALLRGRVPLSVSTSLVAAAGVAGMEHFGRRYTAEAGLTVRW